jgi:hypothetical protein
MPITVGGDGPGGPEYLLGTPYIRVSAGQYGLDPAFTQRYKEFTEEVDRFDRRLFTTKWASRTTFSPTCGESFHRVPRPSLFRGSLEKGKRVANLKNGGCLSMQRLAAEPRLGLRDWTAGRLVVAVGAQGLEVGGVIGVAASVEWYAMVDVEPVA